MKCIIHHKESDNEWCRETFPGVPSILLKIVNKPLVEYYIDLCRAIGINEVCLVMDFPNQDVREFLDDGRKWGISLTYSTSKPDDSSLDIIRKNAAFIAVDSLILITAPAFFLYDKDTIKPESFETSGAKRLLSGNKVTMECICSSQIMSILAYEEISFAVETHIDSCLISSAKNYYDLSFDILKHENCNLQMCGYNNEEGVYIGQDVTIQPCVAVNAPVSFADRCNFQSGSTIGPWVIIGNNSVIDQRTTISGSIIYDNSYVGTDLEFINKIVYKHFLIDPETGVSLSIDDKLLIRTSSSLNGKKVIRSILQFCLALCMLALFFLPGIMWLLISSRKNSRHEVYLSKNLESVTLNYFPSAPARLFQKMLWRCSFDKFQLLLLAVKGKIRLVGNTLFDVSDQHRELIEALPDYQPAVFSYSNMLSNHPLELYELEIHERYFSNLNSLRQDLKVILLALLRRFFYPE